MNWAFLQGLLAVVGASLLFGSGVGVLGAALGSAHLTRAAATGQQPLHAPLNLGQGVGLDHQNRQALAMGRSAHLGIEAQLLAHRQHRLGLLNRIHPLQGQISAAHRLVPEMGTHPHPIEPQGAGGIQGWR